MHAFDGLSSRLFGSARLATMLAVLLIVSTLATPTAAVQPEERLDDPVLEDRARDLSAELRCLVCQNENIDSSNAPLARDLRLLVRERLVAGDSDREVLDFVVSRYGDYVLMRPPFQANTLVLWLGPAVLFMVGIGIAATVLVRRGKDGQTPAAEAPLSAEERAALDRLLTDPTAPAGGGPSSGTAEDERR